MAAFIVVDRTTSLTQANNNVYQHVWNLYDFRCPY